MTAIQEPNKVADLIRNDAPAADARNALGLGSMATHDEGEFEPAGAVASITAEQLGVYTISQIDILLNERQPIDGDLSAIAAISGTGFARRTSTDTWTVGLLAAGDIPDLSATYSVTGHTHAGLSTSIVSGSLWGGQGSGVPAAVAVGTGLSLAGGTLTATGGGGGTPGGSAGAIQYNEAETFGGFGHWDGTATFSLATGPGAPVTIRATADATGGPLYLNGSVFWILADGTGFGALFPGGFAQMRMSAYYGDPGGDAYYWSYNVRLALGSGWARDAAGFDSIVMIIGGYSGNAGSALSFLALPYTSSSPITGMSFSGRDGGLRLGNLTDAECGGPSTSRLLVRSATATERTIIVQGATTQSVNLQEWRDSTGSILTAIDPTGAFRPAALADSVAPVNSLYYSTTQNKLVFKDLSGVVNTIY